MRAFDERRHARATGDYRKSFGLSLIVLSKKNTRGDMAREVAECLHDLGQLGKLSLLPSNFGGLSVYKQKDILFSLGRV